MWLAHTRSLNTARQGRYTGDEAALQNKSNDAEGLFPGLHEQLLPHAPSGSFFNKHAACHFHGHLNGTYTSRSAGVNYLHRLSVNNAVSVGEPLGGARCRLISWLGCSKN